MLACACNPVLGKQRQEDPPAHQSASLDYLVKDPIPKQRTKMNEQTDKGDST